MIFGTPPIVRNGLVLHLDSGNRLSYPGTGTNWTDLSGNGYTGTLTNGPTFSISNQGIISFDGSNDYINFAGILDLTGTEPFTISTWARTNYTGNNPQTLVGKTIISSPFTGYQFGYNIATATSGDRGKVGFVFVDNSLTIMRRQTVISTLNDDVFRNLVCTYDGSKTRAGMFIYVNGQLQSVTDSNSTSFSGTLSNAANFQIAARDGTNQPFLGSIPITMFYNRVLTPIEILQNYNALKNRFSSN